MHHKLGIGLLTLALCFGAVGMAGAAEEAPVAPASTLDNLMAAYNGESNAHARYLAFAQKADEEGYTQVASLFRAAATAEKVHFQNHAKVIEDMGGVAQADILPVDVKSTRENLEAAISGESYERDTMYPEFIAEAKASGNKEALRSFNFAKAVEAQHADLYTEALNSLEDQKNGPKMFYVCSVCGTTFAAAPAGNCPICDNPKEQFLSVS